MALNKGDTNGAGMVYLGNKGTEEIPNHSWAWPEDPRVKTARKERIEEISDEKRERFIQMRWENEEEEFEFFRLAQLWYENPEIFEGLIEDQPEFYQKIIETGILGEYYEVIKLYEIENREEYKEKLIEDAAE